MARHFNGADNEYLKNANAPVTAYPLTMACWFNSYSATADQYFICVVDYDTDPIGDFQALVARGGGTGDPVWASSYRTGQSAASAVTSSGYSINTWHHACGVFAAADDRAVFIDGGSKGTNATSVVMEHISACSIGTVWRNDNPSVWMYGAIAEAAMWNAALTDEEVAILAKGYSPLLVRPQNLVAYWPLIRDTDDDIVGGFSMTPVNSPTVAAHPRVFYPGMPHVGYAAAAIAALRIPRHPAAYYGGPTVF